MGAIDDEKHLVFECPAFQYIRNARRKLLSAAVGLDMKAFFGQQDQGAVFGFVIDCLREVEQLADVDRSLDVVLDVSEPLDTFD